jgi:hypothetical protein
VDQAFKQDLDGCGIFALCTGYTLVRLSSVNVFCANRFLLLQPCFSSSSTMSSPLHHYKLGIRTCSDLTPSVTHCTSKVSHVSCLQCRRGTRDTAYSTAAGCTRLEVASRSASGSHGEIIENADAPAGRPRTKTTPLQGTLVTSVSPKAVQKSAARNTLQAIDLYVYYPR